VKRGAGDAVSPNVSLTTARMKKSIVLLTIAGLGLQCFYSLNLPALVANHFGPGGLAAGGMSNTANLAFNSLALILVAGLYLLMPFVLGRARLELIAFPNRRYWLAPERLSRTLPLISDWLGISGILTIAFQLAVYHLVYLANLDRPPRLDQALFIMVFRGYLLAMLFWLIALVVRFGRIPK
jgi:hypothetical protein